jgi:hypothetical protein
LLNIAKYCCTQQQSATPGFGQALVNYFGKHFGKNDVNDN